MNKKNPIIDILKGIAIVLVVYGHVIEHSLWPWFKDFYLNPVFKIIYTFHMPLFMIISGYLMAGSLVEKSGRDVLISRVKSILIPFLSLSILGILVSYGLDFVFGHAFKGMNWATDLFNQLLFQPSVWYLFTLFCLSVLIILSHFAKRILGDWAFAIVYLVVMFIPFNEMADLYYIKWFYLFYLVGYFLNRCELKLSVSKIAPYWSVLVVFTFGWLCCYWVKNDYIYVNKMNFYLDGGLKEIFRFIYRYAMGFLGIVIVFKLAQYLASTKLSSIFCVIGRYALDIYILQMLILEGIYPRLVLKTGFHLEGLSPMAFYVVVLGMTIVIVGLCMGISKYIIRRSSVLNIFLLGKRA